MVGKKGGGGGGNKGGGAEDGEEDLARIPLQAIVLADSFTTKFRPITLQRPKVLLPLVNVPMIDYTLAWLESAGIEEVFIFCCAHSKQLTTYLNDSMWFDQPHFSVTTIESHNSVSAGDALRLIYERNVIHGDFVLVSGDTISNMSLTEALQEHKDRRKKDANAVMTMVVKQSKPSQVTRQSRLGTDELIMAIDPDTKQLLYYEEIADHVRAVSLDKGLIADHPSIFLHNDKQDCLIDICSPEVLSLFTDNFDYQHLRRHFVKGLLVDDIMGYKIFTHEIHSSYAARIDNFRSYDAISKDIIQRWTYPFVPDIQFSKHCATKLERRAMYRASDIGQSHSAQIGPFTVIGHGSTIGNNTVISNSVVGEGCIIGSNVSIEGCYIWHNVTIEDGCRLNHAIVCDGVIMKAGATLDPGAVLSFKVIVGQHFIVPAYSKVSLLPQPIKQDSDEELEYADNNNSGVLEIPSSTDTPDKQNGELTNDLPRVASEVGNDGAGFIWSISEGGHEEEWRYSVAPIPADKLLELTQAAHDDQDMLAQDDNLLARSGELEIGSTIGDSDDDDTDDIRDDSVYFEKEVVDTFLRAVHEHVKEDHVILEVNSLRLSYNKTSEDCASAIFYGMMKLALDNPHKSASELVKNTEGAIIKWKRLLKYYLPSIDEEIEVILKFEEMCLESTQEFSPLFVQLQKEGGTLFVLERYILHLLYENDVIQEEAILNWAKEKEGADESDRKFVKQSEKLIQWLNEASEEED